jgi:uncharacterized protein (TIGR03083 family)
MSDFARHLPLSQRPNGDESGVTNDRRPMIGDALCRIADLLESLPAPEWEAASLCSGWRVRDVAGHLVWRLGSSTPELLASARDAVFCERVPPWRVIDWVSRRAALSTPDDLVMQLRGVADARLANRGRKGVHELTEVIVHGYDIAHALGRPISFARAATGAVAFARTPAAPTAIKAAVRGRTLVASDAGWSVGHGPELVAPAEAHILFLFGRSRSLPST